MNTNQLEMKLHAISDRLSCIEHKVEILIEKLEKKSETVPVDRNYRGFENKG